MGQPHHKRFKESHSYRLYILFLLYFIYRDSKLNQRPEGNTHEGSFCNILFLSTASLLYFFPLWLLPLTFTQTQTRSAATVIVSLMRYVSIRVHEYRRIGQEPPITWR